MGAAGATSPRWRQTVTLDAVDGVFTGANRNQRGHPGGYNNRRLKDDYEVAVRREAIIRYSFRSSLCTLLPDSTRSFVHRAGS
ncbi:hypothetical protein SBA4_3450019 [Candidatus Sulfopaludibacter sp. SbA4]|nr:hypothetical protein SBA4_3450019 [Candidatus Sulfopaludibacter sp. SbA4]